MCNSSLKKYVLTQTTDNNYHLIPSTRLADSAATNRQSPSTDESWKSTQSDGTTPLDIKSVTRSDRRPDKTKLPHQETTSRSPPLVCNSQTEQKRPHAVHTLQVRDYQSHALPGTGTIQRAMSENELRSKLTAEISALLEEPPSLVYKIQIANGNIVPIRKQSNFDFFLAGENLGRSSLYCQPRTTFTSACLFLSVMLELKNNVVHFSDLSLQLWSQHRKFRCGTFELKTLQKNVVGPF